MTQGIVYVNSAHEDLRYVREAATSAQSFRAFIPDATYVLYTDAEDYADPSFDSVRPASFDIPENLAGTDHKNGQMVAKLDALRALEFDRTMYLGSDTYALKEDAGCMFDLLDRFDIVAAHAPFRINTARGGSSIPELPRSFPEFNCDVVLFRRTPAVQAFLEKWRELYLSHAFHHAHDQGAFRYLVWKSDLQVYVLPPEYNYRGDQFRSDTIVLQNRDRLEDYVGGQGPADAEPSRPSALGLLARGVNKALRLAGTSIQIVRQ